MDQLKDFLQSEVEEESTITLPLFLNGDKKSEYKIVDLELFFGNNVEQSRPKHYLTEKQQATAAFSSSSRGISPKMFLNKAIFELAERDRLRLGQHHRNMIAIVGPASSGKTTFMKNILQEESVLNCYYDFVFFLQCEYIDFESKTNLLQFLLQLFHINGFVTNMSV